MQLRSQKDNLELDTLARCGLQFPDEHGPSIDINRVYNEYTEDIRAGVEKFVL
jgi:hypothetical protein